VLKLDNFFDSLEKKILLSDEEVLFNIEKIKEYSRNYLLDNIEEKPKNERGFYFEEIVCDLFRYLNFKVIQTKKTRDFGLDGIIETELEPFGKLKLGLQVKWKKINASDVDLFIQALNFAEIRLGILLCKTTGDIKKYKLSSKIKAILSSFDNDVKNDPNISELYLEPIFILKFDDIVDIFSQRVRNLVSAVYKR